MSDSLPSLSACMEEGLIKYMLLLFLSVSMSLFRWLGVYISHINLYLLGSGKKVLQSIHVPN